MKTQRYIFSQKLAGLLMLKGFVLQAIRPDKYHNNRNVFIFNDSDALHEVLNEYNREDVLNDNYKICSCNNKH